MIIRQRVTLLSLDNSEHEIVSAPWDNDKIYESKYTESVLGIMVEDNLGARGFYHPQNYRSIITKEEVVYSDVSEKQNTK